MANPPEKNANPFNWPHYPKTEGEFEALMGAIDSRLQKDGLQPFQRPLHVPRLLWEALKWEGNIFPPKELADLPGYTGQVLMAKAHRWYESLYGERLKSDWAIGYFPAKIANALWKVRIPVFYGRCRLFIDRNLANQGKNGLDGSGPALLNVLCFVEDLPAGLAERLSDSELKQFFDLYVFAFKTFDWREGLKGSDLFVEALNDYSSSTEDLLSRRYAQSRWASAQAVEKTLKGLLAIAGRPFPKGAAGHDLVALGKLLKDELSIEVNERLLRFSKCSPAVRYGEENTTEDECLLANHSALGILEQLSMNPSVASLLANSTHTK